jgi:hypothetical protein
MSLSHIPVSFQRMKVICTLLYEKLYNLRDRMYPIRENVPSTVAYMGPDYEEAFRMQMQGNVPSTVAYMGPDYEEALRMQMLYDDFEEWEIRLRVLQSRHNSIEEINRVEQSSLEDNHLDEHYREEAYEQNSHRAGARPRAWTRSRVHPEPLAAHHHSRWSQTGLSF